MDNNQSWNSDQIIQMGTFKIGFIKLSKYLFKSLPNPFDISILFLFSERSFIFKWQLTFPFAVTSKSNLWESNFRK